MRVQPQTCIHMLNSRSPEIHFLGTKASLFDGPKPLDPLEHPKPSK